MNNYFKRTGLYKYPNRYIIVTFHTLKKGGGVRSKEITILEENTSIEVLSSNVLRHLELSQTNLENFDLKDANKNFYKVTGLKNISLEMKNSKYISLNLKDKLLTISSTKNGGTTGDQKGFQQIGEIIEIILPKNEMEIGTKIIEALEKSI